jgi:hypothetical protein
MDKKSNFMENLMRAKQTMDAVEGGNYKVDHTAVNAMMNQGPSQLIESLPDGATPNVRVDRPMNLPSTSQIDNSRLPEAVKKLMKEQPIPKMEMGSGGGPTFTMDDVKSMVQKNVPQSTHNVAQPTSAIYTQVPQPQQLTETVVTNSKGQMLITLTEDELNQKIQEGVAKYMTEQFAKTLREETIKKTMQTLIKEGKLRVRTKKA